MTSNLQYVLLIGLEQDYLGQDVIRWRTLDFGMEAKPIDHIPLVVNNLDHCHVVLQDFVFPPFVPMAVNLNVADFVKLAEGLQADVAFEQLLRGLDGSLSLALTLLLLPSILLLQSDSCLPLSLRFLPRWEFLVDPVNVAAVASHGSGGST